MAEASKRATEPSFAAAAPLRGRVRQAAATPEGLEEISAFMAADPAEALRLWFGWAALMVMDAGRLRRLLDRDVAELDEILSRACDLVLHHPAFQSLEASWRGVHWLAEGLSEDRATVLRLLDCRWPELARDLERASDFDHSTLFRLVYDEEFGTPGESRSPSSWASTRCATARPAATDAMT